MYADMPKANSARIAEAQRQRQNITKKSEKYGPSTVYLQVLGSGARGVPNTLYLFTDQKRYLFNCGECTQRLAHEHKVKLSRLDHIFITSKTWRNIGGLPGLSLTLQDVGVPNITLHGPEGLDELYPATKRFVIMKDMNVVMAKCSSSEDFEDNVMNVKYVLLGPHDDILAKEKPAAKKIKLIDSLEKDFEEFKEFITDETDYYRHDLRGHSEVATRLMEQKKYLKERPKQKPHAEKSPDPMMKKTEKVLHELQKKSHCSVAYICTLKKRLGTLDLAKCVELGVKPGPMLGQLKSGQDVVLPDGTLIRSKEVKTPDDPGPVFIVLEVPELSYLKEAEFSAHFDNGVNPPENIPSLIVHYTPPHVLHDAAYKSFMKLFGPSTRHIIMNEQNACLGSEAVHRTQHKLHLLDPDIFPLLRDVSVPAVWNAQPPLAKTNSPIRLKGLDELKNKIAIAQFQNIINMEGSCKGDGRSTGNDADDADVDPLELLAARTLTIYHLRPKKQLDRSAEPKLHIQDYIQETMDVDGFVPSLEQFRRLVDSMRYAKTRSQEEFPKVVFLGTGSCIPSKTRNTSSIAIHIDENRSMLLDCGEGTFGQLVRFYGPKRVNAFLRTLTAIYVSHLHADHHIGLIGVLQARRQAHLELHPHIQPDPLYLLAPGQIVSWLSVYDQQFEKIRADFTLIPNQSLLMEGVKQPELTSAALADIGVYQIQTCLVAHCPNAFGVSIEIDQHKITYSGDTIPCEALVKLGENSTLLIHEATMEDELADEARMKMHSTTTQAIQIGRQMNARYTLLTHFSQRYARLPRLNPNILNDNNSVGIAFDNMQITMSDLDLLPHMYAPLQLMFAEHCVEMELKAAHRARQRERDRRASPITAARTEARCRRVSPGCRGVLSAPARSPATTTYYRESNASQREPWLAGLRQEMKGVTLSGGMGSPRSLSTSPVRRRLSRSPSPAGVTKPRRDVFPDMRLDVITAPRTISETSTSNVSKDEERRPPSSVPSGSVVDTRSRTLSSASRAVDYVKKETSVKKVLSPPAAPNIGYGKPLLTPVNKRLQLRRDVPKQPSASVPIKKLPPTVPTKSPMRQKAENRLCTSPTSSNKHNLGISRLPVCSVSGSKCPSVTCNVVKTERSPMSRSPVSKKETKPNSSYTKIKSENPASSHSSIKSSVSNVPRRCISARASLQKSNANDRQNAEVKSSEKKSQNISIDLNKILPMSSVPEPNSSLKQQIINTPNCVMGRPSSGMYSNRSFKPQLEDIKSSFILLTKNTQNKQKKHNDSKLPHVTKPKPIDDIARQRQLNEIKKKFQSRGFFNQSKYDKIEGLNWISWK